MGDHRLDINASFEQYAHLVPGLVHLASVNALNGQHVEDHGLPVDRELLSRDAKQRDTSAVEHIRQHLGKRRWDARHFKTNIKTLFHSEFFLDILEVRFLDIDRYRNVAHPFCQIEPVLIYIGYNDITGPRMTRDRRSHDADRTRTCDQNVLAKHLEGKSCMDRISERIEDSRDLEIDVILMTPNVRHRQSDVFGEAAICINADPARVRTKVPAPGHTVTAPAAYEVPFTADEITDVKIIDIRSDTNDLTDEFMTDRRGHLDGRLRPWVPVVNVKVRSADTAFLYADHHVVYAHFWFGNFLDPQSGLGFALYYGFHVLNLNKQKIKPDDIRGYLTPANI